MVAPGVQAHAAGSCEQKMVASAGGLVAGAPGGSLPMASAGGPCLSGGSCLEGPYPRWEFLDCEGDVLQSRSGHTCALYRNRYLYIFGGFDGSNCFDDLYVLDLETKVWRKIEAGGERPSGRASHSAVADDLAGVMYIFGGSGSHFGYTNKRDLCEFCFETETWRLLSNPMEDTPSARYGQSMVAYREGLYVWGGTHGTNYPTDMHRFDLCSKQWELVATMGDLPCGRYRHQAMVKDDLMYIVGGSGINRYGDVFTFHFTTNVWRKLVCTGTDLSDGRYAHSAVLRDGFIYLYGGNDGVRHDDLQQLDLQTRVWSRVTVHGQCPPGRDFHAAVLRRDSMVIFGGSNGMRRHNDIFEFHMAPKNPPCTLNVDMEALFDQAQVDEATQLSCDVFLAADGGETSQGVYCHSQLIFARCQSLSQLVEEFASGGDGGTECGSPSSASGTAASTAASRRRRAPPASWSAVNGRCTWAPVDLPASILTCFVRYLYAELPRFGRLTAEHLYQLHLAAKHFEVPRLAALCERQLKLKLGLENVLPILRASVRDGPVAQSIQEACKHYFLANYHTCTELQECEALDPKLLCELMRLQNTRAPSMLAPVGVAAAPSAAAGGCAGQPVQRASSPAILGGAAMVRSCTGEDLSAAGDGASDAGCAGGAGGGSTADIPPSTLAQDLKWLQQSGVNTDFEVVVQDEVIRTHRFVLVARSRYFASCILTSGMVEAQDGRLVIPTSSPMTSDAFQALLRFFYSGDDILGALEPHTAMYLVDASSFYGLTNNRLKHFCELCVKDSFNEAQVLQLFEASSRLNVEAVRAMALEFIVAHYRTVCKQPGLEQLERHLLVDILRTLAERLPPQALLPAVPAAPAAGSSQGMG
eukprot:TRINITY_DN16210_c0_g2_i1.p1 TRINITY_DN16210_c0_g2~~TRINITY_DN16210_c0_g2_i1.p1  ORF type:complete len:933 (+),score=181.92 TRINITY_DN16210_c0_g2_i1:190-2799(+)